MNIRNYKHEDFETVKSWWTSAKELAPFSTMLPPESTFILELEGKPVLCATLYLTNCKDICYIENFAGNPECKGEERRAAAHDLLNHLLNFSKELGYRHAVCLAPNEKLLQRYQELGFVPSMKNLHSLVKEIR